MGRGRPRHNPILMEAEGAYRKNPQNRPTTLIKVDEGTPGPPLLVQSDELALEIWNEACDKLRDIGLLNKTDSFLIEAFALNLRELYRMAQPVREKGHSQVGDDGLRKADPNVVSYHKLMGTHIKLMNELGLTPSARTRMVGPSKKGDDDGVLKLMERLGGKKSK